MFFFPHKFLKSYIYSSCSHTVCNGYFKPIQLTEPPAPSLYLCCSIRLSMSSDWFNPVEKFSVLFLPAFDAVCHLILKIVFFWLLRYHTDPVFLLCVWPSHEFPMQAPFPTCWITLCLCFRLSSLLSQNACSANITFRAVILLILSNNPLL